jgi:nitrite reductase/ring-hydroxylating ferredoxin subunit
MPLNIAIIQRMMKMPFSCIIIRPGTGKPNFVVGKDSKFFHRNGDLHIVTDEDTYVPPTNECPYDGCEELTHKRRICSVHGDVTDIEEGTELP